MADRLSRGTVAVLLSGGALGVAGTTALEVATAPYSSAVVAYPLNGVVHVTKVLAVTALVAGLLGLRAHLRDLLGRVGSAATLAMVAAIALGAVPYSLVEVTLDPSLSPAVATQQLDRVYAAHPWIGALSMAALPLLLLGIVSLAVVVLRRPAIPRWAPIVSLIAIPVAIAAGALTDAGFVLPHAPTWLFVGLAAYGRALTRSGHTEAPDTAPRARWMPV